VKYFASIPCRCRLRKTGVHPIFAGDGHRRWADLNRGAFSIRFLEQGRSGVEDAADLRGVPVHPPRVGGPQQLVKLVRDDQTFGVTISSPAMSTRRPGIPTAGPEDQILHLLGASSGYAKSISRLGIQHTVFDHFVVQEELDVGGCGALWCLLESVRGNVG
jgi:hypothetical protein